jgi:pimeloyl-ACP methyl ester carboxylesterase
VNAAFSEHRFATPEGLSLYVRDYDAAGAGRLPVVCLAGLSRCHRDFGPLAAALAPQRRVICPDMRGRGLSDRDPDPKNYNVITETDDALLALDRLGIGRAAFVGSSRGGILSMLIAIRRPSLVAGVVLNDIGPVIEKRGLVRIVATLGLTPERIGAWPDAVRLVRQGNLAQFPRLSDAEWEAFARRLFAEEDGRPRFDFDWRLTSATAAALEDAPPVLWAQFAALAGRPALAIRGENSDILSAETLAEMARRMPGLETLTLADRGHCPFLDEPEAVAAIRRLLEKADAWTPPPPPEPPTAPASTPTPSAPPPPA